MTSDKCKRSLWCGLLRELFDHWAALQLIHSILSMLLMAILFPIIVDVSPGLKFGIWRKKLQQKNMTCLNPVLYYHDAQLFDFDHHSEFDNHFKLFFLQNDNLWHLLKSLAKIIRRSLVLKSWSTLAPTLACTLNDQDEEDQHSCWLRPHFWVRRAANRGTMRIIGGDKWKSSHSALHLDYVGNHAEDDDDGKWLWW